MMKERMIRIPDFGDAARVSVQLLNEKGGDVGGRTFEMKDLEDAPPENWKDQLEQLEKYKGLGNYLADLAVKHLEGK